MDEQVLFAVPVDQRLVHPEGLAAAGALHAVDPAGQQRLAQAGIVVHDQGVPEFHGLFPAAERAGDFMHALR